VTTGGNMPTSHDSELGQRAPGQDPGLLTAARRHPLVVVAAVVVAVALAALISLAMPVKYTTKAQIILGDENESTVFRNVAGLNPTAKAQNAAQVMRSQVVFDRASELLDGKVSADRIEKSVIVTPGDNNPLVTLTSTSNTANRARAMANAVGQAYLDVTKDQTQARSERASAALKTLQVETSDTLDTTNEQISERVDKIREKAARTVADPADRNRFVQSQLTSDTRYLSLRSQADRLTTNLAALREKLLESRVDQELVSAGVDTLYKASEPENPTSPDLRRNLLVGAAVGLLIGLALAWRRLDRRRGIEQDVVAEMLGASMLGHVPNRRELRDRTGVVDLASHGELVDDLRGLAATLLLYTRHQGLPGAVVTSAGRGEGKTVLALNLAAAAHNDGHDVVLVDADVRHGDLTEALGLTQHPGLRELLSGMPVEPFGEMPMPGGSPLPVLPVGSSRVVYPPDAGLPDLARGAALAPTVIADSPAVFDDPGALALASGGRAGLLVVVTAATSFEDLSRLRSRAELADAPILGFIYNDHRPKRGRRRPRQEPVAPRGGQRMARPEDQALASQPQEPEPLAPALGREQRH
jgi:capsular polysaccharide biosynthesis protein/Mrp family chromosome partitioning ATPase